MGSFFIQDKDVVAKLFDSLKDDYMDRNDGYTSIIQTGNRISDAAPRAILELVNYREDKGEGEEN